MKFQISDSIALTLSIACCVSCLSVDAYAPSSLVSRTRTSPAFLVTTSRRIAKTAITTSNSKLFSSQWDEEDDDDDDAAAAVAQTKSASYEEAGKGIADEDDKAAMDDMGDFDASGTVSLFAVRPSMWLIQV